MSRAEEVYNATKPGGQWTDIQKHLPMLRDFAHHNVFEIGVRTGISTAALLMGVKDHGGHVWSADIDNNCRGLYLDDPYWDFILGHSVLDSARILPLLPRPLDLLFIDSGHEYKLTGDELHIYGPLVRKNGGRIVMHDVDLRMGAEGLAVRRALDEYAADIGKTPTYHEGDYGLGVLQP